jgi:ribosomal protein L11 methyltransferase
MGPRRGVVPFIQFNLTLTGLDPDTVEAACFATGAVAVTLADAGDAPILEPAPGTTPLWPTIAFTALYDDSTDTAHVTTELREQLNRPDLILAFASVEERVWEREWLKDFHPMRFGQRLWICPGGQPPTADADRAIIVWLDPGLAFGTGTHATTALCLEWLDEAPVHRARILDVGTGSGILAIAALRLGASHVHALDIDPQSLIATHDNAARNDITTGLTVAAAEAPWGDDYDIVMANILAEPLIELAPRIAQATKRGGKIILSGLLTTQAAVVTTAYLPWFDMEPARIRDGWIGLVGTRRNLDQHPV